MQIYWVSIALFSLIKKPPRLYIVPSVRVEKKRSLGLETQLKLKLYLLVIYRTVL